MRRMIFAAAACLTLLLGGCGVKPAATANTAQGQAAKQAGSTVPAKSPQSSQMANQAATPAATNGATANSSTTSTEASQPYAGVYLAQVTKKQGTSTFDYPQIRGLADQGVATQLNQVLQRLSVPANIPSDHTIQSHYALLMKRGAFLEVMLSSYDYAQGAAHGMPAQTVVMMNVANGSIYQIGNLFKPGLDYLSRLSDGVRKADTQHVLDSFSRFTGVTDKDGFYLTDAGVSVYFSPYEWTPYALGFPTFTVPYTSLADIIDKQGALWQALHSPAATLDASWETADLAKIKALGYVLVSDGSSSFAETATDGGETLYVWRARSASVPDGTAWKLFFFLDNRYLGTDTLKDHADVYWLAPVGKGSVSATYASSNGDFTITYHWNGSKLELNSAFPASYQDWSSR